MPDSVCLLSLSTKEDSDFREIFSGDGSLNSIIKFPEGFRIDFFRYAST